MGIYPKETEEDTGRMYEGDYYRNEIKGIVYTPLSQGERDIRPCQ
jgi:hypothetical protein